jgi:hypothetical protein
MTQIPPDLAKRLLFILHRGLTEARNLGLGAGQEQIADLADALEILPGTIDHWDDQRLETIRFVLRNYAEKYPSSTYDYSAYLEKYEPPERF